MRTTNSMGSGEPEDRVLTRGEELVGVNFNPSQNPKVARLKAIFAEAAEIVSLDAAEKNFETEATSLDVLIVNNAETQILNAQMAAVKSVTRGLN